eukprot:jgi/Phyca11/131700/e_gw1.111.63.1
MPSVDTVCEWVRRAWRDTEESTVMHSIEAAGFARDPSDWFIAKHDVYGAGFREKWAEESKDDENVDLLNLSALDDALDDINLVDEQLSFNRVRTPNTSLYNFLSLHYKIKAGL